MLAWTQQIKCRGLSEQPSESLHSDGSATYLLIIWVEKNHTFNNEIETKTISLNCFSKYNYIHVKYLCLSFQEFPRGWNWILNLPYKGVCLITIFSSPEPKAHR